jgi:hypothetical protein
MLSLRRPRAIRKIESYLGVDFTYKKCEYTINFTQSPYNIISRDSLYIHDDVKELPSIKYVNGDLSIWGTKLSIHDGWLTNRIVYVGGDFECTDDEPHKNLIVMGEFINDY